MQNQLGINRRSLLMVSSSSSGYSVANLEPPTSPSPLSKVSQYLCVCMLVCVCTEISLHARGTQTDTRILYFQVLYNLISETRMPVVTLSKLLLLKP